MACEERCGLESYETVVCFGSKRVLTSSMSRYDGSRFALCLASTGRRHLAASEAWSSTAPREFWQMMSIKGALGIDRAELKSDIAPCKCQEGAGMLNIARMRTRRTIAMPVIPLLIDEKPYSLPFWTGSVKLH